MTPGMMTLSLSNAMKSYRLEPSPAKEARAGGGHVDCLATTACAMTILSDVEGKLQLNASRWQVDVGQLQLHRACRTSQLNGPIVLLEYYFPRVEG